MKTWRRITVLVVCLALAAQAACGCGNGSDEEIKHQLAEVVRNDLTVEVSGSGNIGVSNEIDLSFEVGGKVDEIYVSEGDRVTEGEALARLDTTSLEQAVKTAEQAVRAAEIDLESATNNFRQITYPYTYYTFAFGVPEATVAIGDAQRQIREALEVMEELGKSREQYSWEQYWEVQHQLKQAENSLVEAKSKLDRGKGEDVFTSGLIPVTNYWTLRSAQLAMDKAQVALDKAKDDLDTAKDKLEKATITAPFDGLAAAVYVKEGDILASPTVASRPVIHLIDPAGMELTVEVDEIDIASVEPGQKVIIELDALPELQLEGEVVSISSLPEAQATVVAYEVKIAFDVPPDAGVKVGMSADADIIIAERSNVLLVPDRAIDADSQGNSVVKVVVAEGETETRPVVTGISDGLQTEIISGISEGETVVIEIRVKSTSPMGLF